LLSLLLVIAASVGATQLTLNPNNRVFFSSQSEKYQDLLDLEREFALGTSLVLVIHSPERLVESSNFVDSIGVLTDLAWRFKNVVGVSSLQNVPISVSTDESVLMGGLLDDICSASQDCLSEDIEATLGKPHIANRYISRDQKSAAIFVELDVPEDDAQAVVSAVEEARDAAREIESAYGVEVSQTGAIPMMEAFINASSKDLSRLLPLTFLLMLLLLGLILRGVALTLLAFLSAVAVSASTTGIFGWLDGGVNTATSALPIIVGTLYLATSLHFYMPLLRAGNARNRDEVRGKVTTVLNSYSKPILLANTTTAIGLFSMAYVESPPIQQLGIYSGLGVIIGTVVLLIVNPAFLFSIQKITISKAAEGVYRTGNAIARVFDKGRLRSLLVVIPFIVMGLGVLRIDIDEDFVNYFSEQSQFRLQTEKIGELLFGPYRLDVVIDSGSESGIFATNFFGALDAFVQEARDQGEVVSVASLVDVLGEAKEALGGTLPLTELTPEGRAQLYASYEMSLAFGQTAEKLVSPDQRIIRVSLLLGQLSMAELRDLESVLYTSAEAKFDGLAEVFVSGEGVPTAWLAKDTILDGLVSLVTSFIACGLCIWIVFRSLRIAFLASLTAAVPILCGFGLWGWADQPLGIAAVLVVAMTIGVVIDDAIHLVYRYVQVLRSAETNESGSVAYSLHRTAPAMISTTLVLSGGYAVLMFSSFEMNVVFGTLASLVVALAALYNLFVTPQLLKRFGSLRELSDSSTGSHMARSQYPR